MSPETADAQLKISAIPGLGFHVAELEFPGAPLVKLGFIHSRVERQFPAIYEAWLMLMNELTAAMLTDAGVELTGPAKRVDYAPARN
jgi:hypothetical protein